MENTNDFYKLAKYGWKKLRIEALKRDYYECQMCAGNWSDGKHKPLKYGLKKAEEVHHIKPLKKYPELSNDINNLVSLCCQCHNIVENRYHTFKLKPKKKPITEERWRSNMITCVCGMLGAGKTTYVLNNKKDSEIILDYDLIRKALDINNNQTTAIMINKIIETLLKLDNGIDIWLVRTVPRQEEMKYIDKYIWINTEKKQCLKNLKKDNRVPEDIDEIQKRILDEMEKHRDIEFEKVELFKTDEKW